MHIVFAASEGVPFSKTGGLADVGLARCRVTLAGRRTPGERLSARATARPCSGRARRTVVSSITVPFDDRYRFCSAGRAAGKSKAGVQFLLCSMIRPFSAAMRLYGTSYRRLSRQRRAVCPVFPRRPGSVEQFWGAPQTLSTATTGRPR